MDERFADPPTPTLEQGRIFQTPNTTTGTTSRPDPSGPVHSAPIMSGPGWPVDEDSEGGKYRNLLSKLENLEAGNRLILDDFARLNNQFSKITEMLCKSHGTKPPFIESPKASFSKSLNTPKLPNTEFEKPKEEGSPHTIIIPRTTKVARVEIEFESPEKTLKEHNPNDRGHKERGPGIPVKSTVPSISFEEFEEGRQGQNEEGERGGERGGEVDAVKMFVQQLADDDDLFACFIRYLTNPKATNRQIATKRDKTVHNLAHGFLRAATSPKEMATISCPESSDIRATMRKMSNSTRIELYIALSQRYIKEYGDEI
ncbi:hypothetical protein FPSE_03023 [Fusarium pseudograminearum CS3096]|uniref:Uncharacterized protein n=1 Tax=Fusarium pseudograminearum (strain CS3096) TaxID=1028729 RepID=K3VNW3_FUSPC|nr:hypothetical protein FPSE_03023 [Fusarium pseudograminearum CS3096]EKJ76837.1 hypothetical protein FPSE_03023 [Fusarium pseudograminearum CS3096]